MKNLIVGMGEIGKAIRDVIGGTHDVQTYDMTDGFFDSSDHEDIDILHICFPYSDKFVQHVKMYMLTTSPKHVIVYSTVPIGTCEQISDNVVHSPVEGRHPDLDLSITYMERWLGTTDHKAGQFFTGFFNDLNIRVKIVPNPQFTETLKLLSTSEYGINLLFADYKKQVADAIDMPFELAKQWNLEYNKLYENLGLDKRFKKFVLDAPNGVIGGHCVVPNAELLDEQYPSEMLKMIKGMK